MSEQDGKTLSEIFHIQVSKVFLKDNPDLARKNFVEGWNHIINIGLKNYVEK